MTKQEMLAAITAAKNSFLSAIYGKDVRSALGSVADVVYEAVEDQLIEVDSTLTESGQGADSKTVGDLLAVTMISRGAVEANTDLDDYLDSSLWYVSSTVAEDVDNWPFAPNGGNLIIKGPSAASASGTVQIAISNSGKVKLRSRLTGSWYVWKEIASMDDLADVEETAFVANRASLASSDDADDIVDPGSYSKAASATVDNLPKQASGYIYKLTKLTTPYQFYHNSSGEIWYRNGGGWHMASPNTDYGYSLAGKSITAIGASFVKQVSGSPYCPLSKQWFTLIGNKFGMTYYNNGAPGTTIAKVGSGTGTSAYERLTKTGGILDPHTNTSTDEDNGTMYPCPTEQDDNVDYIIIQGGGNDSSESVPLGDIDSTDETEFHGALNLMVAAIRAKFPKAKLLFITCFRRWLHDTKYASVGHNSLGLVDKDYADAMVANAVYNSIPVFDAWHESGLVPSYGPNTEDDSIYAWPWISRENKHLNEDGNAYIAPIIAKRLNEI